MHEAFRIAAQAAAEYLDGLERRPIAPTVDLQTLRVRLASDLPEQGVAPERVVRELIEAVDGGILGSASGRFFGWVIGGTLPAATAADWLTSAWDNNATLYSTSPAAAVVEEVAGQWLKDLLGLPSRASFAFVTGCQMANVTCLAAARYAVMTQHGWNLEEHGLCGAPPLRVLCTGQRHGAMDRAIRLLGLGTTAMTYIDEIADWARAIDQKLPTIVILQAGEINTGAFDDFATLIPLAKRSGAWVHVEGAFGLWAATSPRYRHLLRGVEGADSWATDGHKWLNAPFDIGYAFVADERAHRAAMSIRAGYLTHSSEARDEIDWTPEWSRRARGFPTYAALRELGRAGVTQVVERSCEHAQSLVTTIGRMPGAELLCEPVLNQGLVRFLDPAGIDHDRRTNEVIAQINQSGEAFFTGTTWRGRRAMRVSVCNWRTSSDDVRRTLTCVRTVLERRDR